MDIEDKKPKTRKKKAPQLSNAEPSLVMEKLRAEVEKVRDKWVRDNLSPEDIRSRVDSLLDMHTVEVIGQVFGFDTRWHEWELKDNDNKIRILLEKEVTKASVLWFKKNLEGIESIKLPRKMAQGLRAAYMQSYTEELEKKLREMGQRKAQSEVDEMYKKLVGEMPSESGDDADDDEDSR